MANTPLTKAQSVIADYRDEALYMHEQTLKRLDLNSDWKDCQARLRRARVNLGKYMETDKESEMRDALNAELKTQSALMKKYGITKDDLTPHYHCPICKDQGYIDGKRCKCLDDELRKILFAESNLVNGDYTFENAKYSNKQNKMIAEKCKEICAKADTSKVRNILLLGKTGTGKTYLCTAIANKLIESGHSVLFTTAYALNKTFLQYHLANLAQKSVIMENLVNADALIIDDLGTENVLKNVTMEYLFLLVNERTVNGKINIVCSNLNLEQLHDRYEDRIFGRLTNTQNSVVAQLVGNDIRTEKTK
ncbi:MAG: ATP-binding protein [Corallococcus sp.]|nr:ATP-binding protein [Corallococcus sp.]MCM1290302.1 ATP-binding protein [Corallococcus sp.]